VFKLSAFGQNWSGNTVHCVVVPTGRLRVCDAGEPGTETDTRFHGTEFPGTLENVGSCCAVGTSLCHSVAVQAGIHILAVTRFFLDRRFVFVTLTLDGEIRCLIGLE